MLKLDDVIEALEIDFAESNNFYDVVNDCVVTVSDDDFRHAEDDDTDLSKMPEWQRADVELAGKILYSDKYIRLPGKVEFNEYRHMERFICLLDEGKAKEDLWQAIHGRGAFRRFKDKIDYYGIAGDWYKYRDEELVAFAKDWCESCDIKYEE